MYIIDHIFTTVAVADMFADKIVIFHSVLMMNPNWSAVLIIFSVPLLICLQYPPQTVVGNSVLNHLFQSLCFHHFFLLLCLCNHSVENVAIGGDNI